MRILHLPAQLPLQIKKKLFIFLYLCLLSHPCRVYASIGVFVRTCMWARFHVSVCVVCVYENVSPDLRRQCFSVLGRITLPVTDSETFAGKLYLPRNAKYGRICQSSHRSPSSASCSDRKCSIPNTGKSSN